MFSYYFGLAVRSLKRNLVLTVLMIAAVGVGIGASMTTLTVFRAMDNDPIPDKSRQLFAVQIDNWGPDSKSVVAGDKEHFQEQISYIDAVGLPFVFDTQLFEGRVPEQIVTDVTMPAEADFFRGLPLTIDRTGAGVRRGQMPERNGVFGYNLSR